MDVSATMRARSTAEDFVANDKIAPNYSEGNLTKSCKDECAMNAISMSAAIAARGTACDVVAKRTIAGSPSVKAYLF